MPRIASEREQYSDPALRDRLKKKILAGSKGGRSGQWSARKAQLLASEYKSEGGRYKRPPSEAQRNLQQWTEENWTTSDGSKAVQGRTTKRYLPKKAWDKLSASQKSATNKKKAAGTQKGKQFVPNTAAAADARRKATAKPTKKTVSKSTTNPARKKS